ncbi:phosducin-like protein [Leptidea sinapis]|uniref:phosducin-like protein n=1 Tax=Leptidea sinapis TaxID=189913 RepID=UPI002143F268|nr:phosducin-like protein [Leptidea sinapis]
MATLEDKILGEKLHNYCSSSEDEGSDDESHNNSGEEEIAVKNSEATGELPPVNSWSGTASNTGPKGVIEDWKRYKQLEAENRKEMEIEKIALAKKLTLSVKTVREEEQDKETDEIEDELNELLDEEVLLKYQEKRVQELVAQIKKALKFGKVLTLKSEEDFLNSIDKEDPKVSVIMHIYSQGNMACETMDACLNILANDYPTFKFCRISADCTCLSRRFRIDGVPALLVYKSGQIIGNFVQLSSELGNDFYAKDVQKFLIEYGILPELN